MYVYLASIYESKCGAEQETSACGHMIKNQVI